MKKFIFAVAATTMLATHAMAAEKFEFDKNHTNIMWFANHAGFSDSMGQFMDYDGHILLDEDNIEKSSVQIDIQTGSMMTGLAAFDKHLTNKDFFNVLRHPTATFKSTAVKKVNDKDLEVQGELTMLGITKPLTLNATINKIDMNPFTDQKTIGASVEATVKRSEYGMDYAIDWGISDDVKIQIELEALKIEE